MLDLAKKKLEQLLDSVIEPIWRRLLAASWRVRASVLGLVGVVFAAFTYPKEFAECFDVAYYLPRAAFASVTFVPLREEVRQQQAETVERLVATVRADLRPLDTETNTSWSVAQSVLALAGAGPSDAQVALASYARARTAAACACWTELPNRSGEPSVVFISGWVLAALASQRQAAMPSEINFLLREQLHDGSWPMFEGVRAAEHASAYATAWALMGLHAQRAQGLLADAQTEAAVDAAIHRGRTWLLRTRQSGARWKAYPLSTTSDLSESISGAVLHALHFIGSTHLASIDEEWLHHLPDPPPTVHAKENTYVVTPTPIGPAIDHFEQIKLPWIMVATADAYPQGDWLGKTKSLKWMETVLSDPAVIAGDAQAQPWARAELLYALHHTLR